MAPCTSPRWQPSTWGTTVAMPMATKTSIRHMCCRWMVSSGSFLTYSGGTKCFSFVCATLWFLSEEIFLTAFPAYSEVHLKTVSKAIKSTCCWLKSLETKDTIDTLSAALSCDSGSQLSLPSVLPHPLSEGVKHSSLCPIHIQYKMASNSCLICVSLQ